MPMEFGFCIPVFANPGAAFFRTPSWTQLDPYAAIESGVLAEELGFDALWVADHLTHGVDGGILEGWTTLSVLAGRTRRIRLGTIHLAQAFRHPSLVAKMVATLDALSGGRVIFFYDVGYVEHECAAFGFPWYDADESVRRLDEGLALIRKLWTTDGPVTFDGHYFQLRDAICRPFPSQRPYPPIVLGEVRDEAWLDLIGRHATGWNSAPAAPDALRAKLDRVRAACDRHGRNFDSLRKSLEVQILVAPTQQDVRRRLEQIAELPLSPRVPARPAIVEYLRSGDQRKVGELEPSWLVGTPDDVIDQVRVFSALGITNFMLWFMDFPSTDGMRLFAERVAPALRAS